MDRMWSNLTKDDDVKNLLKSMAESGMLQFLTCKVFFSLIFITQLIESICMVEKYKKMMESHSQWVDGTFRKNYEEDWESDMKVSVFMIYFFTSINWIKTRVIRNFKFS